MKNVSHDVHRALQPIVRSTPAPNSCVWQVWVLTGNKLTTRTWKIFYAVRVAIYHMVTNNTVVAVQRHI